MEQQIDTSTDSLDKVIQALKPAVKHPTLKLEAHTRLRRNAETILDKHCRVGSAFGLEDKETCCSLANVGCTITKSKPKCDYNSTTKYVETSNVGCQLAYTGRYVLANGRVYQHEIAREGAKRYSLACFSTRSLFEMMNWQEPKIECLCGLQGLLFTIESPNDTHNNTEDLRIFRNNSIMKGTETYRLKNVVDFSKLC